MPHCCYAPFAHTPRMNFSYTLTYKVKLKKVEIYTLSLTDKSRMHIGTANKTCKEHVILRNGQTWPKSARYTVVIRYCAVYMYFISYSSGK